VVFTYFEIYLRQINTRLPGNININYIYFEKVGIRQELKEHCSAYFAVYNSVNKLGKQRDRTPDFSNR